MKKLLWLPVATMLWCAASAQPSDPKAEYAAFRREAVQRYVDFRQQANDEYARFMRDGWEWFEGRKPLPVPQPEVPEIAPERYPEEELGAVREDRPLPLAGVVPRPRPAPEPQPVISLPGPTATQPEVPRPATVPLPFPCPSVPTPEHPQSSLQPQPATVPAPLSGNQQPPVVPQPVSTQPLQQVHGESPSLRPAAERVCFRFYGTDVLVARPLSAMRLAGTGEGAVAEFWQALATPANDPLLYDCLALRERMRLPDWGYLLLVRALAEACADGMNADEDVLLQAYVLNQSGYEVRIARSEEERLHLLVACDCALYDYPFWTVGGERYYLTDGSSVRRLCIYARPFPGEHPLRMGMEHSPRFAERLSAERTLASDANPAVQARSAVNENLIRFFDDYPAAFVNNDPVTKWRFYARTPVSEAVRERFYPSLRAAVAGKDEAGAADILLRFVQTAFAYELDDAVWGRDRAFFAEETLYYPYADCEDRAILFSRLVRDLLGLRVVLVYYPGHLAAAVRFSEPVAGDYLQLGSDRYTICDPTYIHAPVGRTMPEMNHAAAQAILL